MAQDKLPGPGRPTNLDHSRTMAYCACSMCGRGLFGHFFSRLSVGAGGSCFGHFVLSSIISLLFPLSGRRPHIG